MPYGQRLAMERLADSCAKDKPTIFIVATHDTEGDIDFANCIVTEYRQDGKWVKIEKQFTIKEFTTKFINTVENT